jgi:tRNA G10  N-methylase Trm11
MASYLFFLGQTADLCLAELQVVLSRFALPEATLVNPHLARVAVEELDAASLQESLGGTFKIARSETTLSLEQQDQVESVVLDILRAKQPKRFVIAEQGRDHLEPLPAEHLKHILVREGQKIGYKDAPRSGANAALLKSSKALEIHILQSAGGIEIALTQAVQDVNAWTLRDVGKPERDIKRGLLQPKIARMMLNLAIGDADPKAQVVLDPFCGAGTVLIEATMMDVPHVLGADLAPEAVAQTQTNLAWWQEQIIEQFSSEVVVSPVENLTLQHFTKAPTVIATEPFLGKLNPQPQAIPGIVRGLEKMYRGAFRAFSRLLPAGGQLSILLPSYQVGRHQVTVSNTLRDAESLGFTQIGGPFRAGRPEAVTQRQVYVFRKK